MNAIIQVYWQGTLHEYSVCMHNVYIHHCSINEVLQGLKLPFFPGGKFLPPLILLGGKLANRGGKCKIDQDTWVIIFTVYF